jgi:hypothetical protein
MDPYRASVEKKKSPASMARQGPRGGGKIAAGIRLRVRGHGLVSDTLGAMDKEIEFDRAGASFRRRRKRASTDQNLPSLMPTSATFFFWNVSLSIETPLRTPPPDKPWARPTRTRVRTVHSAILRLAGVLHGHNLLRAPHKHLQRLCKIWSLVRRITSEVAAAGAAATVSSLSLSGMPIQCG